jgi:G6PDH family F420-dependent oxidoreductase
MLREAVEVMRALWTGETVDHWGDHYTVENAHLFTVPAEPPPVVVSAFGPMAGRVAGEIGDGLWATSPDESTVEAWQDAGGKGMRVGQVTICWGPDRDEAVRLAHRQWPNSGIPGQLSQDLPTWSHFEQAAQLVTEDMIGSSIPCGPDPEPVLEKVGSLVDAGFDHVHLHQIGDDQEGFFRFWSEELAPRLPS